MKRYILTIFFCFVFDQVTKKLFNFEKIIEILNFKIVFSNVYNHGFALGIMDEAFNRKQFLIIFLILTLLLIFIYFSFKKYNSGKNTIFFESIIIGGAISNIFDRISHGHVIDFISIKYIDLTIIPFFNLADAFIVIGSLIIFLYIIKNPTN
jgi:signal peptidase II